MTRYEVYVLIVCTVVFTLLVALLTVLITYIVKSLLRSIKGGLEDEKLKIEYFSTTSKKKPKALSIIDKAFSAIIFLCLFAVFIGAMFVNVTERTTVGDIPRLQVVCSESMSEKHKKNTYLMKNNLNDQFDMFDIIVTHKLPAESELKQYDIVVYEIDDTLVVHRIVNIEEPNEKHPNERYFLLQGDNVESADKFPVKYSQMRAIYRGDKIPLVGSIVIFLQSPAGYLCLILVVFTMIVTPIVDRILKKAKRKRLEEYLAILSQTRVDIAQAVDFEAKMAILAEEYARQKKEEKGKRKRWFSFFKSAPSGEIITSAQSTALLPIPQELSESAENAEPKKASIFDGDTFIATLTAEERKEFISLFISASDSVLPKYNIGGDNRVFFDRFFIYLGDFRTMISESLMQKIYEYTMEPREEWLLIS